MGIWRIDADVLARSRFGVSAMVDTVAALLVLHSAGPEPWQLDWYDAHRAPYRQFMGQDPLARALVSHALAPAWIADFFTVAPPRLGMAFEEELARFRDLPGEQVRQDLYAARGTPLPALLSEAAGSALVAAATRVLEWVWAETVAPEWPRRQRVLQADVVSRTARLATSGWAAVMDDMRVGTRWLGEGRLQINTFDNPPRDLTGAEELYFIPAHCRARGWVVWDLGIRYGMVYPVTGLFTEAVPAVPDALARLLGRGRAHVLVRLSSPMSTTQLVAVTRYALGTVGDHLKVLLDAGLVTRRRGGREVLYWRTAAGQAVVDACAGGTEGSAAAR